MRNFLKGFLGILLIPALSFGQGNASDLDLVPSDGLGFMQIRITEIWQCDLLKMYRDTLEKAGAKYLQGFDQRFFPAPSSLDRLTLFAFGDIQNPVVAGILSTKKPIDRENFLKFTLAGAEEIKLGKHSAYVIPRSPLAVVFWNDQTLIFANPDQMAKILQGPTEKKGPLSEAIQLAKSGKALVAAVNPAMIPDQAFASIPPPFQPIASAKLVTLAIDLKNDGSVDLRLHYGNNDDVQKAETAAKKGLEMARGALVQARGELEKKVLGDGKPGTLEQLPEAAAALLGLGSLNQLDEFLANPPLKKEEKNLHLGVKFPSGATAVTAYSAVAMALLLPAVQKVRAAAEQTQGTNNLKQIAISFHAYHDAYRNFPGDIVDKNGTPILSWRVAILPFLEHQELYRKFKMDEPWDGPNNKKLIPLMPKVYMIPNAKHEEGETFYQGFSGPGTIFEKGKKLRFADITDGTSNTILVAEAGKGVIWTKPGDMEFDPQKPLPPMGAHHASKIFLVALADGSVRTLSLTIPAETLRALITRNGGEAVNINEK